MKYPHIEGREPMLVNPYTGQARDIRDVNSDPYGILVVNPLSGLKSDKDQAEPPKGGGQ